MSDAGFVIAGWAGTALVLALYALRLRTRTGAAIRAARAARDRRR